MFSLSAKAYVNREEYARESSRGVKTVSLPFYRRLIQFNPFFSSLQCSTLPFHPSTHVIRKTNPSRKSRSVRSQTQRTLHFNVNTLNQVNWKFKGRAVLRSGLPNPQVGRTGRGWDCEGPPEAVLGTLVISDG